MKVEACPGSGKTTSILYVVKNILKNILVLTYSKRLKLSTKKAIKDQNHVEVSNYHSFCVKYFSPECHQDKGIEDILKNKGCYSKKFKDFDLIIIDEA